MTPDGEGRPQKLTLHGEESLAAAARSVLAAGHSLLHAREDAAAEGNVEGLHQLRIATRRIRAAIELLGPALNGNQVRLWHRDLAWLADAVGAVRERDVIAEVIRTRESKVDPALAESLQPLFERLDAERSERLGELARVVQSPRYRQMLTRLAAPSVRKYADLEHVAHAAWRLLRPMSSSVLRAGMRLSPSARPEAFHRTRVRGKRLRYALDLLSDLGGKQCRKAIGRLQDLQDAFGDFNDLSVACNWLIAYGHSVDAAPANALAAGAMIQTLRTRQEKMQRRCLKAWRKFHRSAIIRDALEEIRRSARPVEVVVPVTVDAA